MQRTWTMSMVALIGVGLAGAEPGLAQRASDAWEEGVEEQVQELDAIAQSFAVWAERYSRDAESAAQDIEVWAEGFADQFEDWATVAEQDWEAWADYSENWEAWGERYAESWEDWAEQVEQSGEGGGDLEALADGFFRNLEGLGDMPLQGMPRWHQPPVSLEGLDTWIEQTVQRSLADLTSQPFHQEEFQKQIEEAVQRIVESSGELHHVLDGRRDDLEGRSRRHWSRVQQDSKADDDVRDGGRRRGVPDMSRWFEGSGDAGSRRELLEKVLRSRLGGSNSETGDDRMDELLKDLEDERKALRHRDRELEELKVQVQELRDEVRRLRREGPR